MAAMAEALRGEITQARSEVTDKVEELKALSQTMNDNMTRVATEMQQSHEKSMGALINRLNIPTPMNMRAQRLATAAGPARGAAGIGGFGAFGARVFNGCRRFASQ